MSTPACKPSTPKKRSGGRGPITGFAASVIHWRSGKRIHPKTARCFPLHARRKRPEPPEAVAPVQPSPPPSPEAAQVEQAVPERSGQMALPFPAESDVVSAVRNAKRGTAPRRPRAKAARQ